MMLRQPDCPPAIDGHGAPSGLFGAEAIHTTRTSGRFTIKVTRSDADELVPGGIIVLVRGDVEDGHGVPCRVASACVTATALDSAECDCREQLQAALAHIADIGRGVVLYLTHQEGRGHGLETKVRALAGKNEGLDTFAAVARLGLPPDVRTYDCVPPILRALKVHSVVLLSNNPDKRAQLADAGVVVSTWLPLRAEPSSRCQTSMRAKWVEGHAVIGRYSDAPLLAYP